MRVAERPRLSVQGLRMRAAKRPGVSVGGLRMRVAERPELAATRLWRRWTGIEPAGRGSPVPPALKAGEPTRRSDTSAGHSSESALPNPIPTSGRWGRLVSVTGAGSVVSYFP
jgi:hypothetical protein